MTEKKSYKREDYASSYEWRRNCLWRDISSDDDLDYPNIISFFCKRSPNDKQEYTSTVFKPTEPSYDKSYELSLVIRLVKEKVFQKRLKTVSKGIKKRVIPKKSFIDMKEYEIYDWVSLMTEIRYCVLNNEETILLSNKEIAMIS